MCFSLQQITRRGEVAVLVKKNMPATLNCRGYNIETISLKVSCWRQSFLLFAIYRMPGSPHRFMSDSRAHITSFVHKKIFNWRLQSSRSQMGAYDFLCWNYSPCQLYVWYIMLCYNLQYVVYLPTCVHGSSLSVLDLVSRTIKCFQYWLNAAYLIMKWCAFHDIWKNAIHAKRKLF